MLFGGVVFGKEDYVTGKTRWLRCPKTTLTHPSSISPPSTTVPHWHNCNLYVPFLATQLWMGASGLMGTVVGGKVSKWGQCVPWWVY